MKSLKGPGVGCTEGGAETDIMMVMHNLNIRMIAGNSKTGNEHKRPQV
jgi:hypothetical protein